MNRASPLKFPAIGYAVALGLVLALALVLRTANLMNVQEFQGDQGRDYMEVMNWLKDGRWPLLGPARSVGDAALGPGWFYTIAPALALSGFHPVAGAATVALAAVLTIGLIADWLRRASGSRAAALVAAVLMACSARWVIVGRTLWNPHLIPLGVAALAWLLAWLPSRPVPGLAALLALMAILPQWHTTGLAVVVAVLPALGWTLWRARPALRAAAPLAWRRWGLLLAAWLILLYAPPLMYELKPGPGNLASYFSRSVLPAKPYPGSSPARALAAADRLIHGAAHQLFSDHGPLRELAPRLAVGGLLALAFLVLFIRERRGAAAPVLAYLAAVVAGYGVILFRLGFSVNEYCLLAPQTALMMLGCWVAGRCLTCSDLPRPARIAMRGAGALMLLGAVAASAVQFPQAWREHLGGTPEGASFRTTREVAEAIARDSGGRPFSLDLAQPGNFAAHYFYLLRWLGRPPANAMGFEHLITRDEMGERTYILPDPRFAALPTLRGVEGALAEPLLIHEWTIQRVETRRLPATVKALQVRFYAGARPEAKSLPWEIKAIE